MCENDRVIHYIFIYYSRISLLFCTPILLDLYAHFMPVCVGRFTAFSYVDWVVDGPDLLLAIRTGYRGSVSYHNTNRITFKVR